MGNNDQSTAPLDRLVSDNSQQSTTKARTATNSAVRSEQLNDPEALSLSQGYNHDVHRRGRRRLNSDPRIGKEVSSHEGLDRDDVATQGLRLPWKQRLQHVTWAYFTLTMATGGVANVLHTGKCSLTIVKQG